MSDITYVAVARVGSIPEGTGRAFAVQGRMVAVFNDGGEYFAIDDLCPHMGASLADGYLENGVVACPWHAWRFRVCDGTWCDNPRIKTEHFPIRVQDELIQIGLPPSLGMRQLNESDAQQPEPDSNDQRRAEDEVS